MGRPRSPRPDRVCISLAAASNEAVQKSGPLRSGVALVGELVGATGVDATVDALEG